MLVVQEMKLVWFLLWLDAYLVHTFYSLIVCVALIA